MKGLLFLSIYLFIGYKVFSQNLIPNPYFADLESCPIIPVQFEKVMDWFIFQNSPDIFDSCSSHEYALLAIENLTPRKGSAYIGIIAFREFFGMDGRELVGVKLKDKLELNNKYCLFFYTALSVEFSDMFIDKIGVKFFDTISEWIPFQYVEYSNHDIESNFPLNNNNWMKISGSIIGNNQKFMALGSWKKNSEINVTHFYNANEMYDFSYYFFDDFHLYEVKPAVYDVMLPEPCGESEEATLTARYYEEVRWFVLPDTVNAMGTDSVFTVSLTQDITQVLLYSRLCEYEFTDTITLIKPVCPPEPEPIPVIGIPNIITPNYDGVNDVFIIENLPEGVELYIYNRWGNLIFETSNYNNQWQPTSNITDGVYYYLVKLPNGESRTGFFTIAR